jgi:hypothetical protein
MDDFQTINDIVNESVRNSSYVTVIISSCVFICYTLVIKLIDYFKSKDRGKPILEMANAIKENTANIVKLNGVLDKTLKEAERKELRQCENTIELGFKALAFKLTQEAIAVIIHNNIQTNRSLIVGNLTKLVSTEYYRLYSIFSAYEISEVNVATKLKDEWIKEIADNIIAIVYDDQDSITRITQLSNRISIYVNEYSTYIKNKIFNT